MTTDEPTVKEWQRIMASNAQGHDPVEMPPHYRHLPVECIDVTEHFNFCLGNALKYIWRADHKGKPVEDIKKAIWYLQREVERREKNG